LIHSNNSSFNSTIIQQINQLTSIMMHTLVTLSHRSAITGRRYLSSVHVDVQVKKAMSSVTNITLFQYSICPFCNINKALLAYTETPYKITEVNPLTKAEHKFSTDGYKKVPIATIVSQEESESESESTQINGSEKINEALLRIPSLLQNLSQKNNLPLETFQNSPKAQQWQTFAREDLAPILYPNICRSLTESYQAFGYVDHVEEFTGVQKLSIQMIGSLAMYFAASKIKTKRNISDEREALRNALMKWGEDGLDKGKKLYGSGMEHPDMGDLAMFGVMNSVSGLKTHDEMILGKDGGDVDQVVLDWYLRMQEQVLFTGGAQWTS
jgi:microsomal prostaglandin-E synthase 2